MIEGWLAAPACRLALRFPPALEERFEADTGAERSRILSVFGFFGFLLATMLYPGIRSGLPDIAHLCRQLYLEISMPLGFAISASLWFNPRPFLREGLTLLANLIFICITFYLFAVSRNSYAPLFVAGVVIMMVNSAVGIQLRFRYALVAVSVIVIGYGLALHVRPDITAQKQVHMIFVAAVTGGYLMVANWRLERVSRRSYLLILRERLQRQHLSQRNVELHEMARRDALTGLANRRAYDDWLATAWAQEDGRLGLIVIDIDRFKAFNDFYGHAAGDDCLKTIAVCLREQLRGTSDLVARLGGEEFAVLLPTLPEAVCADVADRLRLAIQRLELPHSGIGPHGLVTISAGVASLAILPGMSPGSLFDAADSALYQAKMSGRNQVCVATMASAPDVIQPAVQ